MKDSSDLVGQEIPRDCRICRCYCLVVNLGGKTYHAQFLPQKGAWGNFCVSEASLDKVKALVPPRSFDVILVAVIANTRTNQAFSLDCLSKALLGGVTATPLHYVTWLVLPEVDPNNHFRWEPGTPEPGKPFVARTAPTAFVTVAGTRGA